MVLNFLGLAGNIEDHGLEMSPSGHRQIAPEFESAGSHLSLKVKIMHIMHITHFMLFMQPGNLPVTARAHFQNMVFHVARKTKEIQDHLGLQMHESIFD